MPCSKAPPGAIGVGPSWASGAYATEEECLQACREGACCEGTGCSVKPACQCQGTGKFFQGVGTTCNPDPCLVCGCITRSLAPQKLYARFSGFSNFEYFFGTPFAITPRPPAAEAAAAAWLNTILVDIPLTRITKFPGETVVSYGAIGCLRFTNMSGKIPCPNCTPPFNSSLSGTVSPTIFMAFACSGGFTLPVYAEPDQRPRWTLGPAFGCEPPGLDNIFTTNISIRFSRSQVQQNWCSIAQGVTQSFTLTVEESAMTLSELFSFHNYKGSGGTVTISTNPLP